MMDARSEIRSRLTRIRRRWFALVWLRVGAWAVAAVAVILLTAVLLVRYADLRGGFLLVLAGATVVLATAAALTIAWPWRRRPSDLQVARYTEERWPDLDDGLAAATALIPRDDLTPVEAHVVTRGARLSAGIEPSRIIDPDRLRRRGLELAVAVVVLFACLWVGRDAVDRIAQTARARWFPATLAMRVMPGDAVVRSSDALDVAVAIDGVDIVAWDAPVIVSAETASGLKTFAAEATDDGQFVATLPASLGSLTYSVQSRGLSSSAYRMRVISPPRVRRVDVAYQYPAFTGLKPREQTDSGDVFAPKGTKATIRVHLADPVAGGRLTFGDAVVGLTSAGDGVVAGTFTVQGDTAYRVNVVTADGLANEGDPEYFVRVMDDRPPDVRLVRPGSDRKVTRLEEALIEARADDDYGLSQFELVYSVRGGAPTTVPLLRSRGAASATGTHTIYVEDLGVQPGDFISYFAQARDIARGKPSSETRSDIFFLEVRPFTEEFEAAQSQAMMAGGGAGSFDDLAGRQKDIIIATWRLDKRLGAGKSADDIRTIAKSQAELKAQAIQLAARMNPPAPTRRRPPPPGTTPAPAPALPANSPMAQAVEAMTRAQAALEQSSTSGALPHENAALNALLKAQAEQLRRQVARQQGQGGGQQSGNQDLSALFDRELQRQQQTNYENRPQAASQNQHDSPERAADKLKELARRQEDLAREQRELAKRQQQLPEEELKRRLERLTREQERLQREADEAARQMARGGASAEQRNAMREASREMAGAAGDLSKSRAGQASERSAKAGEQLRNASRALEGALPDARRRAAGDWQFNARTLAEAQRRLAEAAARLAEGGTPQQSADRAARAGDGQRAQAGQQGQAQPQGGGQQGQQGQGGQQGQQGQQGGSQGGQGQQGQSGQSGQSAQASQSGQSGQGGSSSSGASGQGGSGAGAAGAQGSSSRGASASQQAGGGREGQARAAEARDHLRQLAGEQGRLADRASALEDTLRALREAATRGTPKDPGLGRASEAWDRAKVDDTMREAAERARQAAEAGGRSAANAAAEQRAREAARRLSEAGRKSADALDRAADAAAAAAAGDAESRRLAERLARARDTRAQIDEVERRLGEMARAGEPGQQPGDPNDAGQQGQQGQQGEASQQGQRGQQGGEGQQGRQGEQSGQQAGGGGGGGGQGGGSAGGSADMERMIERARSSLEQLRRDDPGSAQGLPTPEQWFPSRSAPGTEAFKQDYAKWDVLKKDVRLAVERLEQSLAAKLDERGRRGRVDIGRDDRAPEPWRAETARYFRAVAEKSRP